VSVLFWTPYVACSSIWIVSQWKCVTDKILCYRCLTALWWLNSSWWWFHEHKNNIKEFFRTSSFIINFKIFLPDLRAKFKIFLFYKILQKKKYFLNDHVSSIIFFLSKKYSKFFFLKTKLKSTQPSSNSENITMCITRVPYLRFITSSIISFKQQQSE
jgi:hypothetical protein